MPSCDCRDTCVEKNLTCLQFLFDCLIMLHLITPASRGASSRDEDREALPEEPRKEINEGDDDDIKE